MTEAFQRDAIASRSGQGPALQDPMEHLPLRPRHHLPTEVPPLWLTLLARWAATEVRAPRASARD